MTERKQIGLQPRSSWAGWLLFILITAAVVGAGTWFIWRQVAVRQGEHRAQAGNQALGIPEDYPSQIIPIYPGVKIIDTKRETAKSDDGRPMDKWFIHATTEAHQDKVHDYYLNIVTKLGLSQTMGIQIPTGYGFNYANQELIVEFTVEKRAQDPLTHLEITLYKMQ